MATCNADIRITKILYLLGSNLNDPPQYAQLEIRAHPPNQWFKSLILPITSLSIKRIRRECPLLICPNAADTERDLISQVEEKILRGVWEYIFTEPGLTIFPNGQIHFLLGNKLVPEFHRSYTVATELSNDLAGDGSTSISMIESVLLEAPKPALLAVAYTALTTSLSLVRSHGVDLQALLFIYGGQGLGKTTLAKRVISIYNKEDGSPDGFVQAGSTIATIEDLLLIHRDQPIIVDDLCLSAGKETQRKRRELVARLMREGTGNIPITKKVGKEIKQFKCQAGVVITAEFFLENHSDITRYLIVPIKKPLNLPDRLTPALVGDMIRHYAIYMANNSNQELAQLDTELKNSLRNNLEARLRTNYGCLQWAFDSLIRSLSNGLRSSGKEKISSRFKKAMEQAIKKHLELKDFLLQQIPQGNLAFILLKGYQEKAFGLTTDVDKLHKYEGIVWKKDLCLRPEALLNFVRNQPGYQTWTKGKIRQKLMDIGALVLQEEDSYTVHLQKSKPGREIPRVYRIQLDALKENAKKEN